MKARTKILIALLLMAVVMVFLPWLAMQLPQIGIDLMFACLFVLNSLLAIVLGLVAGTDLRKLWWIPFMAALLFPLLLGIVLGQIVVELYVYAATYLLVGVLAMLSMHLIWVLRSKRKKQSMTIMVSIIMDIVPLVITWKAITGMGKTVKANTTDSATQDPRKRRAFTIPLYIRLL